jgi:hypothetical protein
VQHGDRNAFKRGFYVRAFPSSEIKEFGTYTFQGLQEEIAGLRLLNCRAIERASLHVEDDVAFQDAARASSSVSSSPSMPPFAPRSGSIFTAVAN